MPNRQNSIGRKLTAAIAGVTGVALVVATTAFALSNFARDREAAGRALLADAALVAENVGAAVVFEDRRAAAAMLATLSTKPDVRHAILLDGDGRELARYGRESAAGFAVLPFATIQTGRYALSSRNAVAAEAIVVDGRRVGTVVLESDLGRVYVAFGVDILVSAAIAVLVLAAATFAALRIKRALAEPIERLTGVMDAISQSRDYSLRAAVRSDDEIGLLARGLNEMLGAIAERDAALEAQRARLESEVQARTGEISAANARLTEELAERERAEAQLQQAHDDLARHHRELELLSELTDQLQVCHSVAETAPIVALFGNELFSACSGAVYLFDESRAQVRPAGTWGEDAALEIGFPETDCWALRQGKPHVISARHPGLTCAHVGDAKPAGYLCIPMIAHGTVLGILHVRPRAAAHDDASIAALRRLATAATEHLGLAIASLGLRERLQYQSVRDPLTGLFNRRYMEESLDGELLRAQRTGAGVGVLMIDVDHFKRYNDAYGHDAGDLVLASLASVLRDGVRAEDIACRYGGEEFCVILPGVAPELVRERAERLRGAASAMAIEHRGRTLGAVTISVGIALFPEHGESAGAVVRAADVALYRAKRAGRDRVEIAGDARAPADAHDSSPAG